VESGYRILKGFYGVKVSHNAWPLRSTDSDVLEVAYLNHSQDAAWFTLDISCMH